MASPFLHVRAAEYLGGHKLLVEFTDGSVREVDLSGELEGEIFEPLRHEAEFARVYVNPDTGTVEWPNGADFAPEFLHERGVPAQRAA